jgi:porphobilinogen synthase
MVKPAGYYLDLIPALRVHGLPVAAFQVSGEYAMLRAAAAQGWLSEREAVLETLTCIRRAGADLVITYFARQAAGWLREEQ